jgi:methionyl-tRNA formyltransferase
MALRLVFMGTPDFAVPTFLEIVGHGHEVVAIYTRAAQPAGRGMELRVSPVEREAHRFGIPVLTPSSLKAAEAQQAFRDRGADAAVVVAYGLILPAGVLEAQPLGCFNLHASVLPRWRGAAPINRAIMAGDPETAVAVMKMASGLDTGSVAMMERVGIDSDMTAGELHDRLALLGADLMVRALAALEHGSLQLTPQAESGVTYASKISNAETRIDWAKPWQVVHDHCRGLSPYPGAWFPLPQAEHAKARSSGDPTGAAVSVASRGPTEAATRVKVLRTTRGEGEGAAGTVLDDRLTIACASGAVRIIELQRAGRQPMPAEAFLRGNPIAPGTRLNG